MFLKELYISEKHESKLQSFQTVLEDFVKHLLKSNAVKFNYYIIDYINPIYIMYNGNIIF